MADGIDPVVVAVGAIVSVLVVFLVFYWFERKRWAAGVGAIERRLKELEDRGARLDVQVSALSTEKGNLEGRLKELGDEVSDDLGKALLTIGELKQAISTMQATQAGLEPRLDALSAGVEAVEGRLNEVEDVAQYARKFAHEHALLGSKV